MKSRPVNMEHTKMEGNKTRNNDVFFEGGGRPFDMRSYKPIGEDGRKRAEDSRLEIDMSKLEQPGVGPVHFSKKSFTRKEGDYVLDTGKCGLVDDGDND